MSIGDLFFSFKGRIPRWEFWWGSCLLATIGIVLVVLVALAGASDSQVMAVPAIYALFMTVPSLALQVKRLHDRGKSGWFSLIGLVPFGVFWLGVELFFLGSEEGENQYGPEPAQHWNAARAEPEL
jgi:uncharacterized membrane protein YhaH (DUF805 family)